MQSFLKEYDLKDIRNILKFICCFIVSWANWIYIGNCRTRRKAKFVEVQTICHGYNKNLQTVTVRKEEKSGIDR